MKKERKHTYFIRDIFNSIESIELYVADMNYEEFVKDSKTANAVIRMIEIIGEASKNIPEGIKEKYQDIPWRDMSKMRDKIVHSYFKIDYPIVWNVVKFILPDLKQKIEFMLKNVENNLFPETN